MKPAGHALGRLVVRVAAASGRGAALQGLWRAAVGETVARHAWPAALEGGVLVVACDAAAWRDSLEAQAPALLARLQAAVGEDGVRSLVFRGP